MSERSFKEFLIALDEQDKESVASFDEIVSTEIQVVKPAISERLSAGRATELRPGSPASALPPAGTATWELEVTHGLDAGRRYPLADRASLGRDWNTDIALNDQQISRRHAQIQRAGDGYQIVDQGSSNGTFVNGNLISMPTRLKVGDEIRVGDTRMVLRGPQSRIATDTIVQAAPAPAAPTVAPKKFCTKCGARLKPGKRFCTLCGARFG